MKEVFVADDGKEFSSKEDCAKYEEEVSKLSSVYVVLKYKSAKKAIVDYLIESFQKKENIDISQDNQTLSRLEEEADKVIIALEKHPEININLPFLWATPEGPLHLELSMTKQQVNKLTCTVAKTFESKDSAEDFIDWSKKYSSKAERVTFRCERNYIYKKFEHQQFS